MCVAKREGQMEFDALGWASRVAHILAAITAGGGIVFMRFALHPAATALADDVRKPLLVDVRGRWAKWVGASIGLLLLSGIYNLLTTLSLFKSNGGEAPSLYHMLFGIKFLAALALFAIASILAGRSEGTQKFRERPAPLLNAAVVLLLVIVSLSAVLRGTHVAPTAESVAAEEASPGAGE